MPIHITTTDGDIHVHVRDNQLVASSGDHVIIAAAMSGREGVYVETAPQLVPPPPPRVRERVAYPSGRSPRQKQLKRARTPEPSTPARACGTSPESACTSTSERLHDVKPPRVELGDISPIRDLSQRPPLVRELP